MAERIQRSRARGWRMPAGAIYVGRPTLWGNDFRPQQRCYDHLTEQFIFVEDAAHAVALYRAMWEHWLATDTLGGGRSPYHAFDRIRGRDLVCWCPLVDQRGLPVPCHADVLLELANRDA